MTERNCAQRSNKKEKGAEEQTHRRVTGHKGIINASDSAECWMSWVILRLTWHWHTLVRY